MLKLADFPFAGAHIVDYLLNVLSKCGCPLHAGRLWSLPPDKPDPCWLDSRGRQFVVWVAENTSTSYGVNFEWRELVVLAVRVSKLKIRE